MRERAKKEKSVLGKLCAEQSDAVLSAEVEKHLCLFALCFENTVAGKKKQGVRGYFSLHLASDLSVLSKLTERMQPSMPSVPLL